MKKFRKVLAVVLALVLAMGTLAVAAGAAESPVTYPVKTSDGSDAVTADEIKQALAAIDTLIVEVINGNADAKAAIDELKATVAELGIDKLDTSASVKTALYSDEVVNALAEVVYGLFPITVSGLTLDFSAADAADMLDEEKYASAKATLESTGAFAGADWGVVEGDADSFIYALAAAFRPVTDFAGFVLIDNAQGQGFYGTLLYPIFEALGLDAMTSEEYTAACKAADLDTEWPEADAYLVYIAEALKPLLNDVCDLVDGIAKVVDGVVISELFDAPVTNVFKMLPKVAALAEDGTADKALALVASVNNLLANSDTALAGIYALAPDLKATIDGAKETAMPILAKVLEVKEKGLEVVLNEVLAEAGVALEIPEIPFATLAAAKDEADAFVVAARFLFDTVTYKDNLATLTTLLEGVLPEDMKEVAGSLISGLFAEGTTSDDFIVMVVRLLVPAGEEQPTPDPVPVGDAGVAVVAAVSLAAAAAFVFTKKRG